MARPAPDPVPVPRTMRLPDGRALAWIEVGDPTGRVVVCHHGGLSSGWDVAPADDTARELGLRLVSPDRPGIGGSDRSPGRTPSSWADDVVRLLDRLGVDRSGSLGWSLGGIDAIALAAAHPERVDALGVVAGAIPADWEGMRSSINAMDRRFMRWSRHAAGRVAARAAFRALGAAAGRAPRRFARSSGMPASAGALPAAMAHGLRTTGGVLDDYRVLDSPWGVDPAAVSVPTQLWQGDADELVPPDWARRLADAIPGAELTVVPGATHFLWYDHWRDVLAPFST